MTKGQRAGNGAIAVNVEEGKSYYWCSCGKSVAKVRNNLFVIVLTKDQNLIQLCIKLKRQKKCFFVLANKLTIRHSVMVHTINNL